MKLKKGLYYVLNKTSENTYEEVSYGYESFERALEFKKDHNYNCAIVFQKIEEDTTKPRNSSDNLKKDLMIDSIKIQGEIQGKTEVCWICKEQTTEGYYLTDRVLCTRCAKPLIKYGGN